jgi:hypothetical protein
MAETMEEHPEPRVVCFAPHAWTSLNYQRARCLIRPHAAEVLNRSTLRRMVEDMLAAG